jgi:tetratricopeptide (TPR) repeat protein
MLGGAGVAARRIVPGLSWLCASVLSTAIHAPARGADEATWQALVDASIVAESEGRVEDAEGLLIRARGEAERPGTAPMLLARSVESLGDFYHRSGRPEDAEPLLAQSIRLWEGILGPGQPRVGIPIHNLAVLYLEGCRVDQALPLIHRALSLWESTLGPRHADRVAAMRTAATLLRACGRAEEAAKLEPDGTSLGSEDPVPGATETSPEAATAR